MDQKKTGKFIAEERKKRNYTQRELADKLGISDKTVSKWECGNGFPDVSLLLPLCNELGFTVNDLLSGEKLGEVDYKIKAEEHMIDFIKRNKASREEKIISLFLTLSIIIIAIIGCILGKVYQEPETLACIGIMFLVSLVCIAATWIAVTISLKKR